MLDNMETHRIVTTLLIGCCWTTTATAQEPLDITTRATRVIVTAAGRPLMSYRYADVPHKPYVEQFRTPLGINVLRDSPHDHKHHHALMFAVSVDGVNFWEEQKAPGQQKHLRLNDVRIDKPGKLNRAAFTEAINWVNPRSGELMLRERRTIELYHAGDLDVSLLTWQSRFNVPPGKPSAVLAGSRYFGLGARFLESMDTGGEFTNADAKTGVDGTNAIRSNWCAYAAQAEGKPVTVAMFDHPTNVRHPATWFTMAAPFAYLAATINLDDEPLTIPADKPLTLRYGVALWDGKVEATRIEKLHERWSALPPATSPATVTPSITSPDREWDPVR